MKVKVDTVQTEEFWKENLLDLRLLGSKRVSKDEAATFSCMAVQVSIDVQSLLTVLVDDRRLHCVDGRMQDWVRIYVHSVQVQSLGVVPPVASIHSIWVQEWHNLKDKFVEKSLGLHAKLRQEV